MPPQLPPSGDPNDLPPNEALGGGTDLLSLGTALARAQAISHAQNPFGEDTQKGIAGLQISDPYKIQNTGRNARMGFLKGLMEGGAKSLGNQYNAAHDAQIAEGLANMFGGNDSGLDPTLAAPLQAAMHLYQTQTALGNKALAYKTGLAMQHDIAKTQAEAAAKSKGETETKLATDPQAMLAQMLRKSMEGSATDATGAPQEKIDPSVMSLMLPGEQGKRFEEEIQQNAEFRRSKGLIEKTYKKVGSLSLVGKLNFTAAEEAAFNDAKGAMAGQLNKLIGTFPRNPREIDWVSGYIPDKTDGPERSMQKMRDFLKAMDVHEPTIPIWRALSKAGPLAAPDFSPIYPVEPKLEGETRGAAGGGQGLEGAPKPPDGYRVVGRNPGTGKWQIAPISK